jgi:predicted RNA-binding protein with RPS1 domain
MKAASLLILATLEVALISDCEGYFQHSTRLAHEYRTFSRQQALQLSNIPKEENLEGGWRRESLSEGGIGGQQLPFRRKKQKPLQERRGARPMSAKEQKQRAKFEEPKLPVIPRLHAPADRVPLDTLQVGQKLSGRVISVTKFGMFVDVGSKKDGLVHIKDVSKDYFVHNLQKRYHPGQDLVVWVKFVDETRKKLGLQLFPVTLDEGADEQGAEPRAALSSLKEQAPIKGKVVRVSNYGVYLDVGCSSDAFVPRRRMQIGRRRRSFQPWEILPLGSVVNGWVYSVDPIRSRAQVLLLLLLSLFLSFLLSSLSISVSVSSVSYRGCLCKRVHAKLNQPKLSHMSSQYSPSIIDY